MKKPTFKTFLKHSIFALLVLFQVSASYAQEESFLSAENSFAELTKDRIDKVKEGSKPFILSQHKKAPTVVLIHGLSDSPGSLVEVAQVYYKLGYNVVTVLLRDHGLLPAYRHDIRAHVSLGLWRVDVDKTIDVALSMSDSSKIALLGFSMGGALATDAIDRHPGIVSSLVLLAPLFKMNYAWLAPTSKYLKYVKYSTKKDVDETTFFYKDIALNQTYQAYRLTKFLKNQVTKHASKDLKAIPKFMFLTSVDATIENDFARETAKNINLPESNIIEYQNPDEATTVLHRDLPMRIINASQLPNPHIDDLLSNLERFLLSVQ